MKRNRRPLGQRLFRLKCDGRHAPLKIPRKLKKEWQKAILKQMPRIRKDGTRRRVRLRWVPGNGWTVTITHRAYVVVRGGLV
jgi:hypothetical protein